MDLLLRHLPVPRMGSELVKQACSKLLMRPNTLSFLTKAVETTLTKLDSVLKDLGLHVESLAKLIPDKVSKVLLEHYAWTWTSRKIHKVVLDDSARPRGILKGSRSGSRLPRSMKTQAHEPV